MVVYFHIGDIFQVESHGIIADVKCVADDPTVYLPCENCIFFRMTFDCHSIYCRGRHFVLETYNQQVFNDLREVENE